MKGWGVALEFINPSRIRLPGMLALLLVVAQMLFAAHADALATHAPQTCQFCLSASIAGDPNDLNVEVAAPAASFDAIRSPVASDIFVAVALLAAHPRGPPLR